MNGNDQSVRMTAPRPPGLVTRCISLSARTGIGKVLGNRAGEYDVELAVFEWEVVDVGNPELNVVCPRFGTELVGLVDHRRLDVYADHPTPVRRPLPVRP